MPQTREHLDILELLGVAPRRGGADQGRPGRRRLAGARRRSRCGSTSTGRGFGGLPDHSGLGAHGRRQGSLLAALAGVAGRTGGASRGRTVRLPVDRAFVVEGFGTVVTGTLWQGSFGPVTAWSWSRAAWRPGCATCRCTAKPCRWRSAGQRTAVALAGVSARAGAPRASGCSRPTRLVPSHMIDVRLRVLKDAPKALGHRQRVRFHLGASEVLGRVALLEGETSGAGARCAGPDPARGAGGGRPGRPVRPAVVLAGARVGGGKGSCCPWLRSAGGAQSAALDELRREENGKRRGAAAWPHWRHAQWRGIAGAAARAAGVAPSAHRAGIEETRGRRDAVRRSGGRLLAPRPLPASPSGARGAGRIAGGQPLPVGHHPGRAEEPAWGKKVRRRCSRG